MLVIKGRSKKSLVLNEKLKEWNKKDTLVIDSIGFNHWIEGVNIIPLQGSVEEIINSLNENKKVFKKYKRIVFCVNCTVEDEFKVWKFEQEMIKTQDFRECVVTIQDKTQEELLIYEV